MSTGYPKGSLDVVHSGVLVCNNIVRDGGDEEEEPEEISIILDKYLIIGVPFHYTKQSQSTPITVQANWICKFSQRYELMEEDTRQSLIYT